LKAHLYELLNFLFFGPSNFWISQKLIKNDEKLKQTPPKTGSNAGVVAFAPGRWCPWRYRSCGLTWRRHWSRTGRYCVYYHPPLESMGVMSYRLLIGPFKFKCNHLNINLTVWIQIWIFLPYEIKRTKKIKKLNLIPHPRINTVWGKKISKKFKTSHLFYVSYFNFL
jgi:hypothetical protein